MVNNEYSVILDLLQKVSTDMVLLTKKIERNPMLAPIPFFPDKLELAMVSAGIPCPKFPCKGCDAHTHRLCTEWLIKKIYKKTFSRIVASEMTPSYGVYTATDQVKHVRQLAWDCQLALQGGYGKGTAVKQNKSACGKDAAASPSGSQIPRR